MWDLHHELVLFLQSRNCFRYVSENETEGDILSWTTSMSIIYFQGLDKRANGRRVDLFIFWMMAQKTSGLEALYLRNFSVFSQRSRMMDASTGFPHQVRFSQLKFQTGRRFTFPFPIPVVVRVWIHLEIFCFWLLPSHLGGRLKFSGINCGHRRWCLLHCRPCST